LNNAVICSKLLRKPEALKTVHDIDKEEWKQIDEELKVTVAEMQLPVSFCYFGNEYHLSYTPYATLVTIYNEALQVVQELVFLPVCLNYNIIYLISIHLFI